MSPETLQTFGILAIGLGFALIGLGGLATYHGSQKLQHVAELREAEQKGKNSTQMLTLMLKNQELQLLLQRQMEKQPAPSAPPDTHFQTPSPPPLGAEPEPKAQTHPEAGDAAPGHPPQEGKDNPEVNLNPMVAPRTPDWREPESLEPEISSRYLSGRQRRVIADTLRAHGRHTVAIESSFGDPVAREFAEELGAAFAEGDWLVRSINAHQGLPLAPGVTVSAGSFPPKLETRAVYEALLSAGIPVNQQLDPKQRASETLVLVGAPP